MQLAALSAGVSREALLRGMLAREYGPEGNTTLGISRRFRQLVEDVLSLGWTSALSPGPSVADIARSFGHADTARLDAESRGELPLSFEDGDRFCAMFGSNRRWLETGESAPYATRAKFREPTDLFRDYYQNGMSHKRFYFVLCRDEFGTAAVYGQVTNYLYELLLDEVPIHDSIGGGGFGILEEFCLFVAAISPLANLPSRLPIHRSTFNTLPSAYGKILGKAEFQRLVYGEVHPTALLNAPNTRSAQWFEDLADLEYRSSYSENYDRAKKLWVDHMVSSDAKSNEDLVALIRKRLKMWEPTDLDLARKLQATDPNADKHEFRHYSGIVEKAHDGAATTDRSQVRALFDVNAPLPEWLDSWSS